MRKNPCDAAAHTFFFFLPVLKFQPVEKRPVVKAGCMEMPPAVSSCALDERASDRFRELPFTQ
ncbi:hypothetical protein HMPREF1986_00951 [Oribacterium sp. oral taxon 078 str. F0263]|nr:hypothetical protein HMPREF1986_00951 [Oribacterium sp. oral taxon 078 str. F0263]